MLLHMIKSPEQRAAQLLGLFKKSVVRGVFACVVPNPFRRVEFRPVGGKLEHFHKAPMFGEPLIGFLLFVIGGVILNQIDPMAATVKSWNQYLIDESQIRLPLEIIQLVQINEFCRVETHRSKNFLRIALSTSGDLRLEAPARPGRMQGRRLTKGGFVFKNDHRPFAFGVFFRLG